MNLPCGSERDGQGVLPPALEEVELMHRRLSPDEREELLECLLIAAPHGGEAMLAALEPWLLVAAVAHLSDDASGGTE